jgi:uncharacterized RDD family membrane protein YckC
MTKAGLAIRGIEALIDVVLCYLILYVVAAMTGNTIEGGGFYLDGASLIIGIGLCLLYFVVLEAMLGATLGKLATNLRVVSAADGTPIGWSAAIVRNLMRLVDGAVLYIIGFIAICPTEKRQRLGDLVAGTMVVRRAVRPSPTASKPG